MFAPEIRNFHHNQKKEKFKPQVHEKEKSYTGTENFIGMMEWKNVSN
jgi:hypothetical protein